MLQQLIERVSENQDFLLSSLRSTLSDLNDGNQHPSIFLADGKTSQLHDSAL